MPARPILLAGDHNFLARHLRQVIVGCTCPIQVSAHGLIKLLITRRIINSPLRLYHRRPIRAILRREVTQSSIVRLVHHLGVVCKKGVGLVRRGSSPLKETSLAAQVAAVSLMPPIKK